MKEIDILRLLEKPAELEITRQIRESARKKRLLVNHPSEFKTSGDLKWEIKEDDKPKLAFGYKEGEKDKIPLLAPGKAYFCDDCDGWVSGTPIKEKYDEIDILSGSKGYRLRCGICSSLLLEVPEVLS